MSSAADKLFEELYGFMDYYRKAKDHLPPTIRVNAKQHEILKKWADSRASVHQDKVILGPDGKVTMYRGIEVRLM